MGYLFEVLTGAVDGVNDTFNFSAAYSPGSAAIYLNGQLIFNPAGNAWTESDPATGEITIAAPCIPRTGDVLSGFALDTAPPLPETIIDQNIYATIGEADTLRCAIFDRDALCGRIEDAQITGVVAADDSIIGHIQEDTLKGETSEC